jgi:hypothetical protein
MKITNHFKNYILIFSSIYTAYFLSATYSEILKLQRDFWYQTELFLYLIATIIQSLIVLLIYILFFNFIYKIKLKNITLYFLTLFITIFYFLLEKFNITQSLFIYFMCYCIWLCMAWFLIKKNK